MTTGSSSTSSATSDGGGTSSGISTFRGQERALRADRLGTGGLLLSVLAATAPLMVVAGVMPTTFAVMGIEGQPLLFVLLGVVLVLFSVGYAEMSRRRPQRGRLLRVHLPRPRRHRGRECGPGGARRVQRPPGRHLRHLRLRGLRTVLHLRRPPSRLVDTGVGGRARRRRARLAEDRRQRARTRRPADHRGRARRHLRHRGRRRPRQGGPVPARLQPGHPQRRRMSAPPCASASPRSSASNRPRCTPRRPAARTSWCRA